MEKEYLTVKELADILGQTKQTIYYHLNNKLKKYSKTLKGEKVVSIKALKEVYGIDFEQEHSKDIKKDSKDFQIQNELVQALKERIESLEQDKKHLQESNNQLQTLLSQEQALHLATQTKLLTLEQQEQEQEQEQREEPKKWFMFWK